MSEFEPMAPAVAYSDRTPANEGRMLPWPPPGLTRMQGDLYTVSRKLLFGGAVLVLPLLATVLRAEAPIGQVPFGEAWWVLIVTSLLGIGVLLGAFVAAFRLMRRFADAVDDGYDARLVALVAADAERDSGFLIQGARAYATVSELERGALRAIRITVPLLLGAAALWLLVGFSLGVLLAARDALSRGGLAWFVLAPVLLLGLAGTLARAWGSIVVRRLRREWHLQPSAHAADGSDVTDWQTHADARVDSGVSVRAQGARGRGFRIAAALVVALAILVSLPLWPLVITAGVGPAIADIGHPSLSRTQQRLAASEPLRRLRPPIDRSVSPLEAGRLLHTLAAVGRVDEPDPLLATPVRSYSQPWLPVMSGDNPTGVPAPAWSRDLLGANLDAAARAYVAQVAAHPAHEEFSRLASAAELDALGGRFDELPDGVSLWELPMPRVGSLREAAYAHVGRAIHELAQGRPDQAEQTIREVIGVGFLLADDGTSLLENVVGTALLSIGGDAMEAFYRATDRSEDAERLALERATAAGVAERMAAVIPTHAARSLAALRDLPPIVLDRRAMTGMRWESLFLINTVAPCLDLGRTVFGPGQNHEEFIEAARASLVRYPSEARLFEIARAGWFSRGSDAREPSWPTRLLTFAMGGRGTPGSCASLVEGAAAY